MTNDNNTNRESFANKFSSDIMVTAMGIVSLGIAITAMMATSSGWPIVVWIATVLAGTVLIFTGDLVPRSTVDLRYEYLETENKRLRQQLGQDINT